MEVDFSQAELNPRTLTEWYNNMDVGERNEATTRLQFIDRLLFGCLGWDRKDCIAEESVDGMYADYTLYCPHRLLILEAKKEGTYFQVPAGTSSLKYGITHFDRHAPDVGKAITQAMTYCQTRGAPYGVVCNGHQLVAFVASRSDGQAPSDSKALVFDSLESMGEHFLLLWQCLSKPGTMQRHLSTELADVGMAPVPEKLSVTVAGYPGFKRRNDLQTSLQILADLFIEDLAHLGEEGDEREFLRECFCSSGALSQYAMVSKEILRLRYSSILQKVTEGPSMSPATTKKGINPESLERSLSRRPILLIGDRGVGKTTFIRHMYQIDAEDIFSDALTLYVDFGSGPSLERDVEFFIGQSIESQLWESYEIDIRERNFVFAVLHRELEQFERGVYADIRDTAPDMFRRKRIEFIEEMAGSIDDYLPKCLSHLENGRKMQIVLFLDNVDQRTDDFQERVFLIGQSIAEKWPVSVFISIGPETFYKSRTSGTMDAYHPRAFTIHPPRVDEVVTKRLKYGIKLLERGTGLSQGITLRAESLEDYLGVLSSSFGQSRDLIEFLDNMCGGNIRLALNFVRAFIGSGHVDTEKILTIYRESGSYLVPLHEFLRAVIFGDHEHYSPSASHIANLFDMSRPDGREHFLSPILLAQLLRWSQNSTTEGYVKASDVFAYMQGIGYVPTQISWALARLLMSDLLETPTKSADSGEGAAAPHYRISTVGAYYVRKLVTKFSYIDGMIVDTPIVGLSGFVGTAIGQAKTFRLNRLHGSDGGCSYDRIKCERDIQISGLR